MILTGILGTWNMQSLYTSYNPHDDVEVHVVSSTGRFFCVLDALDFQHYYPYLPLYQTLPPPPCTQIGYSTVPYISRLLPILQIHIIIKIVSNDLRTLTKCIFNLLFFQVTRLREMINQGFCGLLSSVVCLPTAAAGIHQTTAVLHKRHTQYYYELLPSTYLVLYQVKISSLRTLAPLYLYELSSVIIIMTAN